MSDNFELTMQEPPRRNERLSELGDLVGETILATFDTHDTREGHVVIVTETLNWLVLDAEADGCGDDPYITTPTFYYSWQEKTLAHYVKPKRLFDSGCINADVYAVLQKEEDEKEAADRERRANYHARKLAELKGGSA